MKKALFALLILALVMPVFADDALVMPARVIRTYLVGVYATADQEYDSDGKKQDLDYDLSLLNLGMAVEYGINDWVTGAVQWVPGYNVTSKLDGTGYDKATLSDAADLFVGAKIQIVGPKAPVKNESFRFAVAPGFKIPLSSPDWEEEATNKGTSKDWLASPADKHTLAVGSRFYADYLFNESFFLNLYSQFLYYPSKVKATDASLKDYGKVATLRYTQSDASYDPSLSYGYDLTFECEPHYSLMVGDGLEFSAGLPFTYTYSPAVSASDDTYGAYDSTSASHLLTLGPNASLFFQKTFLPVELKLGYTLPLLGQNETAFSHFLFELKAYAKF
jgi:hypothetical protein